jgi:hypothetical protein
MILGWSESYHTDVKREAEQELRKRILPLLESTAELRETIATYRDFADGADELELLLERLQKLLEGYLQVD